MNIQGENQIMKQITPFLPNVTNREIQYLKLPENKCMLVHTKHRETDTKTHEYST